MADRPERPVSVDEVRDALATEILRVNQDAYGTGAHRVDTYVLEDVVLMILEVELTQSERTLIEAGKADAVRHMREAFQDAIAPTFKAIVERNIGRRVETFMSHMHMAEPPFSVELFRLGPDVAKPEEPS